MLEKFKRKSSKDKAKQREDAGKAIPVSFQRNSERSTRHFTRFENADGSHQDVEDEQLVYGIGAKAAPLGDDFVPDRNMHLDQANGRSYRRVYRINGINGRMFETRRIGGNGWSVGVDSTIVEVDGPDAGKEYRATLGGGVTFRQEEPKSVDDQDERR